jgi:hypothetical protein
MYLSEQPTRRDEKYASKCYDHPLLRHKFMTYLFAKVVAYECSRTSHNERHPKPKYCAPYKDDIKVMQVKPRTPTNYEKIYAYIKRL